MVTVGHSSFVYATKGSPVGLAKLKSEWMLGMLDGNILEDDLMS